MEGSTWQERVQAVWKSLNRKTRRVIRTDAQCNPNREYSLRCRIILNLTRGYQPGDICEILCSRSQVTRIAKRFVEEGPMGLADRREDNGETKITEEYASLLLEMSVKIPEDYGYPRPTWTQELFIKALKKETGIQISKTSMSRLLRSLGIRHGNPKPIVLCPWKKRRKTRRLNQILRLIEEAPDDEVVLYVDEVDIHLNPKIGSDWMPSGMQKTVLTPGKNKKTYLAGGLDARTGKLTWVQYDSKTSDLFIKQLWSLIKDDYPKAKKIHLILDNYRIHKSKRTEIALSALNGRVELHFLPPYCPDHNKIERVWRDLHGNVTRNHRCKTLGDLMHNVRRYLRVRDRELQQRYQKERAA